MGTPHIENGEKRSDSDLQLTNQFYQRDSALTVDCGEYFNLIVDLYFDPWTKIEVSGIPL